MKIPDKWTVVPIHDLCLAVPSEREEDISRLLSNTQRVPTFEMAFRLLRFMCNECVLNPENGYFSQRVTQLFQDTVATCSGMKPDTKTADLVLKGNDHRYSLESLKGQAPNCECFKDKRPRSPQQQPSR